MSDTEVEDLILKESWGEQISQKPPKPCFSESSSCFLMLTGGGDGGEMHYGTSGKSGLLKKWHKETKINSHYHKETFPHHFSLIVLGACHGQLVSLGLVASSSALLTWLTCSALPLLQVCFLSSHLITWSAHYSTRRCVNKSQSQQWYRRHSLEESPSVSVKPVSLWTGQQFLSVFVCTGERIHVNTSVSLLRVKYF